jgi:hypothetical protein
LVCGSTCQRERRHNYTHARCLRSLRWNDLHSKEGAVDAAEVCDCAASHRQGRWNDMAILLHLPCPVVLFLVLAGGLHIKVLERYASQGPHQQRVVVCVHPRASTTCQIAIDLQ